MTALETETRMNGNGSRDIGSIDEPRIGALRKSPSITKIAPAFVAAQKLVTGAKKDAENPHFKSRYADLASVMDACRDAMSANDIAVLQTAAPAPAGKIAMDTTLMHASGEWFSATLELPVGRDSTPQSFGSAWTYARRYALAAFVGVCPVDDDDDANEASQPRREHREQRQDNRRSEPARQAATTDDGSTRFVEVWTESLAARGATAEQAKKVIVGTLNQLGKRVSELTNAKRQSLINDAMGGKFDHYFKTADPAPVTPDPERDPDTGEIVPPATQPATPAPKTEDDHGWSDFVGTCIDARSKSQYPDGGTVANALAAYRLLLAGADIAIGSDTELEKRSRVLKAVIAGTLGSDGKEIRKGK